MAKVSSWFVSLAIYIAFIFGELLSSVGTTTAGHIVSAWEPYKAIVLFCIPALFGYLAAKDEGD